MNDDAMAKHFSEILELLPEGLSETEKAEAQRIRGNLKNLSGVEQDPQKEKERQEHKKAVAEVYYILSNLEEPYACRIPSSFKKFLEEQKWENYTPKNISRLREEAYVLLDIVYRHFLSSPEDRPHLQLKHYIDSGLQALEAMKKTAPSRMNLARAYAMQIESAKSTEELLACVRECGLESHLQFIMEKEEKISLLFS